MKLNLYTYICILYNESLYVKCILKLEVIVTEESKINKIIVYQAKYSAFILTNF